MKSQYYIIKVYGEKKKSGVYLKTISVLILYAEMSNREMKNRFIKKKRNI